VQTDGLADLLPDREKTGLSDDFRVLEDHGDLFAAHFPSSIRFQLRAPAGLVLGHRDDSGRPARSG